MAFRSNGRIAALFGVILVWIVILVKNDPGFRAGPISNKECFTVRSKAYGTTEEEQTSSWMEYNRSSVALIVAEAFHSKDQNNSPYYCGIVLPSLSRPADHMIATAVLIDFTHNESSPLQSSSIDEYSVLATATDYHIAGGVFVTSQAFRFHTETTFSLRLLPAVSDYKLLVHTKKDTSLICLSSFTTPYVPSNSPPRNNLPSCQASNSVIPWDGDWVGPNFTLATDDNGSGASRTGWQYLSRECNLKLYTTSELQTLLDSQESQPPKQIVILGSSIQRGVYLSLLDIMVAKDFKKELANSVTAKCWGRASVQVGSLEVIYQDFRVDHMHADMGDPTPTIECHGDKVALGPGLTTNATLMFQQMFKTGVQWPDVIYMAASSFMNLDAALMKKFLALFPLSWTGKLILGYGRFNGLRDIYKEAEFQEAMATAQKTAESPEQRHTGLLHGPSPCGVGNAVANRNSG